MGIEGGVAILAVFTAPGMRITEGVAFSGMKH